MVRWFYSSLSNKHWLHNSEGIKMTRYIFILVVYNLFMMVILSATRNRFENQHRGSTSATVQLQKKKKICVPQKERKNQGKNAAKGSSTRWRGEVNLKMRRGFETSIELALPHYPGLLSHSDKASRSPTLNNTVHLTEWEKNIAFGRKCLFFELQ